jgi:DNA-binding response OmpR family regulator
MPCRTLIVEDDPIAARALLTLVKMLGHEATVAATVTEALAKLDEFNPECVLLDLELPDGTGVEVLKTIREKQRPVKVAVISALDGAKPLFETVTRLEPDVVFQKPLAIDRVHGWLSVQGESATRSS